MSDLHFVVLAAGEGKRMASGAPKVVHPVLFQPMIHHVLNLIANLQPKSTTLIVGHGGEKVREACANYPDVEYVVQEEQFGTGHALKCAAPRLREKSGSVVVLCGDCVLLSNASLTKLVKAQIGIGATVLTADMKDPTGYGRIIRGASGSIEAIQEQKDCSSDQKLIKEVNSGAYCFSIKELLPALDKINNQNQQKEYYLTDTIRILISEKSEVQAIKSDSSDEIIGINDRKTLSEVTSILRNRINTEWAKKGVTIWDPSQTWICAKSKIENDVEIEPGAILIESTIGKGVRIEAGCRVSKSQIGSYSVLKQGSYIEQSQVGDQCSLGPYAHLRPGTILDQSVKLGNFVETKKAHFHSGAKASHLSYIGDAEIGENVNLGCGFVTCNYDGKKKNKTVIEDEVFVGSDSQTVAPVTIGKGSYVASGTTVTENVPEDSLVISRGKQVIKPGYAKKYKE